jgi:membrane protease YdiL (CAAX protease family)
MKRTGQAGLKMNGLLARLSDSPFIADLDPRERSLGRFLLTLALGVVALVAMAIAAFVIALAVLVAVAHWPAPTDAANVKALMLRVSALGRIDKPDFAGALQILLIAIPSNVLPIFAFVAVAVLICGGRWKSFLTAAARYRWRLTAAGVGMSAILIGPFVAIGQWMDPKAAPPPLFSIASDPTQQAIYCLVCVLAFFPAALGEELLFRGWLLRQTSAISRNAIALMIVNGALFAAAHAQFEPDAFLERWIMGAGFTYMTLRVGGIELSTGAHFANNLMIVLFLEPLTLKQPPDNGLNPDIFLPFVGLFVAYVAMAELAVRWGPLRRWSLAVVAPTPPPAGAVPVGPWSNFN